MIAAKHEEVTYPSASQFVQIADNCFTLKQLLACEFQILETVGYRINTPLAANILRLYEAFLWPPIPEDGSVDSVMQKHVILLATYLVEVASVEYMMLQYLPSTLAAAALAVSSQALERPLARAEAAFIETLSAPGVQQAVNDLSALHVSAYNVALEEDGNPLVAIKEKYALPMWKSVSKVAPANPTAAASCSSE